VAWYDAAMKRAGLVCFHIAAGMSLLLCVAAVGAWGWGRTHALLIERVTSLSRQTLAVTRGEFRVLVFDRSDPLYRYADSMLGWKSDSSGAWDILGDTPSYFPKAHPPVAGFFGAHAQDEDFGTTLVMLPMWFVVSLFALLPSPQACGSSAAAAAQSAWPPDAASPAGTISAPVRSAVRSAGGPRLWLADIRLRRGRGFRSASRRWGGGRC